MKLYGAPPNRSIRPIWLLNELDLDCEIIPVDTSRAGPRREELLAANPFGKMPVLVDGELRLSESAAIPLYLAERYGRGRFIPSDPLARAKMQQWIFFLVTEVEQPLWRMVLHSFVYPEAERRKEEVARAARDARPMLAKLEAHMEGREWLVGDTPSVADFIAAYTLDWADWLGLLDETPALKAFVERLYARKTAPPRIGEALAAAQGGTPAGRLRHAA